MLGNALTALTVALAAAGQAAALVTYSGGPRGVPVHTTHTGGTTESTFQSTATATCKASSWSKETSASKNGYAKSVELAVADLCHSDWWKTWDYSYAADTIKDYAYAFAQAQAEAYVSCETTVSGKANAKACGLSAAYAKDSADAWAGAFAAALAIAVTDCSCATDAVYAYADASVAVKLWADAHAFATAAACAEGNQVSEAYAYTDCYASAFAEITAHALARAYVDAKCWPYGEDAVAFAEAKASVDIDVTETYVCKFTTGTTGTGGTTVGGGAGTFVFPLH